MRRALSAGFASVRRAPLQQVVAIGTIAVAVLLVCLVRLIGENVTRVAAGWGRGVQMTVYLEDGVSPTRSRQIAEHLGRLPEVERVAEVEPKEAWARLKKSLGDRGGLLDGIEESMLPSSLEVTLKPGAAPLLRAHPSFEKLRSAPGVEDVEIMGDWVDRVAAIERLLHVAGLALGLLVAAACLYIVASTIRLAVFARKDEIEILKLVGATDGFVKAPFLVEGTLQGAAGAALALALVYALFRSSAPWIEQTLGAGLCASPLGFLSPFEVVLTLGGGALLGFSGSALAVGRHVRA